MHDRNGTPLKKGDVVLIECVVTDLQAGEDCNVSLETSDVRRPDGEHESISINAGVVALHKRAYVS